MRTEAYSEQVRRLPESGRHLIGQIEDDTIVVYQAYNDAIAAYALEHQRFGGPAYSFNRMSWIKPGFLWMMYRSGWGMKENQERILAIHLSMDRFKEILSKAVISAWDKQFYPTQEEWKLAMQESEVRLQWDPDHDPYGNKQLRKAIQLGMKGDVLHEFCTKWIKGIADITGFVKEQNLFVQNKESGKLQVPFEEVIGMEKHLSETIGIDKSA